MIRYSQLIFVALLVSINVAYADHAADLAKCNAMADAAKRSACLALVARPGEASPNSPAAATSAAAPHPAPKGREACVWNGDFGSFQDCLDKADAAGATEVPASATQTETESYYAAISRCGEIQNNPTFRVQCFRSVGQPGPRVEIPRSTYDEEYQAAISLCVANRYTIDAEACELDALMQAMQRQRARSVGSGTAPAAAAASQKAKSAPPKRATPDDVVAMLAKLGNGPGRWVIRHERSQITDTENIYLSVVSREVIPREFGSGAPAYLTLRCLDNETDVLITMAGNWFYDDHLVTSRIDKRPAVKRAWMQSSDNEAAFHPEPIAFIKQLSSASQLIIQTAPVNSRCIWRRSTFRALRTS